MCIDMIIHWNERNKRSFPIHRKINQVSYMNVKTKETGKNCFENDAARITVEKGEAK